MIAIFINIFSWIIKLWLNYDEDLEHCLLTKDSQTSTSCCPKCGSYHTIKNGSTHNGKPKRQCKDCGRQFVINPTNKTVSDETNQQQNCAMDIDRDFHNKYTGQTPLHIFNSLIKKLQNIHNEIDKLHLTGRVFNSRSGCVITLQLHYSDRN